MQRYFTMPNDQWLAGLRLAEGSITVRKRNGALVIDVDSELPVKIAEETAWQVGDMVKILCENEIVDSDDSDTEFSGSEAYGLVTSVDTVARTIGGLWVYKRNELPVAASRLLRTAKYVLTTDTFKTPVDWASIMGRESPKEMLPGVLLWDQKRVDSTMTWQTLQAIMVTAGHNAPPSGPKRQRGSMFDLPGHAAQFKEKYDLASPDTQAEMTVWAKSLYAQSFGTDWSARINELNVLEKRLRSVCS